MAEITQVTQMDVSDTKDAKTAIVAIPTVEEQAILNDLFWTLFKNSSDPSLPHSLRSVIGLMQHIADGRIIRHLRAGLESSVDRDQYIKTLNRELTDMDTSHIRFDATGLNNFASPCLFSWALTNDEETTATSFPDPESVVRQTFQLLKRSGGVTLNLACMVPTDYVNDANVYNMALRSSFPYWTQCLQREPSLDAGWSLFDIYHNTPLSFEISTLLYDDRVGHLVVSTMTDDALNKVNVDGKSLVWLAVAYNRVRTLRALLLRPALNLNHKPGNFALYNAICQRRLTIENRLEITAVFDEAAQHFAPIILTIRDAFYSSYHLTLDLPVCTIIYHYYRIPYPRCECNPKLAASAPLKHSPYCFCFPSADC